MSELTPEEKKYLIELARKSIKSRLEGGKDLDETYSPPESLKQKRGCFVTLHKKGALRGCIGTIEPVQPLLACVKENARHAAFEDPRFSPLERDEFDKIDIEISVLTVPKKLEYSTPEELLDILQPKVHGVILSQGFRRSTFLPQVWEQLPDKVKFLENLCLKAGLSHNAWMSPDTVIEVYTADYF